MNFFNQFLRWKADNNLISEEEIKKRDSEFKIKYEKAKDLFTSTLRLYNSNSCQCAYPRFQQIVGIDCCQSRNSFKCYDTDLLITLTKEYFNIEKSELNDENTNEKWVCKKC